MTRRTIFGRHYALAVVVIIFTALLAAAGLRSTPGVLMVPWGQAFGWSRQTLSLPTSAGTLIVVPGLSAIAASSGWKPVVVCVAIAMTALIPLVYFLLPENPSELGLQPFGADADHPVEVRERVNPLKAAFGALGEG